MQKATEFGIITLRLGLVRAVTPFKVIQGHRFWYLRKLICDFLLVINSNIPPILHRFQDTALEWFKIAIFGYPLRFNPLTEGFPWDDLRKIFTKSSQMTKVPNGVKTLPKISIP